MDAWDRTNVTEVEALRAIAHPLRARLLGALRHDGPATATELAARFVESSGSTIYHLRQLERYGFIVEDEDAALEARAPLACRGQVHVLGRRGLPRPARGPRGLGRHARPADPLAPPARPAVARPASRVGPRVARGRREQ